MSAFAPELVSTTRIWRIESAAIANTACASFSAAACPAATATQAEATRRTRPRTGRNTTILERRDGRPQPAVCSSPGSAALERDGAVLLRTRPAREPSPERRAAPVAE